jgi:initiation factor 1A
MYQSRIQNKKKRTNRLQKNRDLEFPDAEDGTFFAIVKDMLGNGRVRVFCEDGSLKMARIRGKMRKSRGKTIIDKNDLVIISGRDFDDKFDIMYKYTREEVALIIKNYEIPEKIYKNLTESDFDRTDGTDDIIIFCDKNEQDKNDENTSDTSDNEDESEDEKDDDNEDTEEKKEEKKEEEFDIDSI